MSLADIQQKTRIPVDVLRRFEEGDLVGDPTYNEVYLKAFSAVLRQGRRPAAEPGAGRLRAVEGGRALPASAPPKTPSRERPVAEPAEPPPRCRGADAVRPRGGAAQDDVGDGPAARGAGAARRPPRPRSVASLDRPKPQDARRRPASTAPPCRRPSARSTRTGAPSWACSPSWWPSSRAPCTSWSSPVTTSPTTRPTPWSWEARPTSRKPSTSTRRASGPAPPQADLSFSSRSG